MLRTPQTRMGLFALITILTAGTAIGRAFGLQVDEALYLTLLLLVGTATAINHWRCKKDD